MKNQEVLKEVYNTICYKVADEKALIEVSNRIAEQLLSHEHAGFNEPDMNNEMTAFAAFTGCKELFQGLVLA